MANGNGNNSILKAILGIITALFITGASIAFVKSLNSVDRNETKEIVAETHQSLPPTTETQVALQKIFSKLESMDKQMDYLIRLNGGDPDEVGK